MIINIPIEPIPMRYSTDWLDWTNSFFTEKYIPFITIYGKEITKGIEQGRFLDSIGTNYYKSSQLQEILFLIQTKVIPKNSTLFFHDLWFPGIEQIKYTSDLLDLNLKFTGCLHAGTWDPNDFLYQKNLGNWACHFENMLFQIVDLVFVATNYHKDLILKSRAVNSEKIKVTGFPFYSPSTYWVHKKNQIVFPHRFDPEKNYDLYVDFVENFELPKGWSFITTFDKVKTKEEYYKILWESKIALSFADQESWGIAMQEAVCCNCAVLLPDKLSYKEMYSATFRYKNIFDLQAKLSDFCNDSYRETIQDEIEMQKKCILFNGKCALNNIMDVIGENNVRLCNN